MRSILKLNATLLNEVCNEANHADLCFSATQRSQLQELSDVLTPAEATDTTQGEKVGYTDQLFLTTHMETAC